jgi:hypothetical protein
MWSTSESQPKLFKAMFTKQVMGRDNFIRTVEEEI